MGISAQKSVWKPHAGPQTEILRRSERELLYGGARGGGKTEAGLAWMGEPEYFYHPKYRLLVIRKTAKDLDDWLFRAKGFFGGAVEIGGNPLKIKFPGGGMGSVGHMADMSSWEDHVGSEYHKELWEELTLIPKEEQYLRVLGSCRSTVPELRAQSFASTNPGGPGHVWVKNRFVEVAKNKCYRDKWGNTRIFIPSKIDDNPTLMNNDPNYIKYLDSLPEPLRSAWRNGDWDCFDGQFFSNLGEHNREKPFELPWDCQFRLFGALDHGIAHDTSFGIGYLDSEHGIHLVGSYLNNGGTTSDHVRAIFDMVESCRWTHGIFPCEIFYDPSMDTKKKINEQIYKSDIDEYKEYFFKHDASRHVRFTPANNRKVDGCHIMRETFATGVSGVPIFHYFDRSNEGTVDSVKAVLTDKNNTEIYAKQEGDDAADQLRYLIVGIYTVRSNKVAVQETRRATPDERPLTLSTQLKPLFFSMFEGKRK